MACELAVPEVGPGVVSSLSLACTIPLESQAPLPSSLKSRLFREASSPIQAVLSLQLLLTVCVSQAPSEEKALETSPRSVQPCSFSSQLDWVT